MNYLLIGKIKNKTMKTVFFKITSFLLVLNLLTFCTGCEPEYNTTYTIKNDSGKSIKINTYKFSELLNNEIILRDGESFIKEVEDLQGSPSSFYRVFENKDNFNIDSITIIYDNLKIDGFSFSTQSIRNPLLFQTDDTFTFTEEDYENAEDCN